MDKETELSSCNLYHFTDRFEILKSIIENGIKPSYSLENFFFNDDEIQQIAIPMSCFCDIPFNLSEQHRNVYGKYGIVLTKIWGEKKKICPIIYLPAGELKTIISKIIKTSSKSARIIEPILKNLSKEYNNPEYKLFLDYSSSIQKFWDLSMYTKPYIGSFKKGSYINKSHKFYDEREWRYKPTIGPFTPYSISKNFLTFEEYEDKEFLKKCNAELPYLEFKISDIVNVVVKDNKECGLINEIAQKKFGTDIKDKIIVLNSNIN